jgi:acyl carrier protein
MPNPTYDDVVLAIRSEISAYYDDDYGNDDHFVRDLRIASDDLSAVALSLEKRFGRRLPRDDYQHIWSVNSYATILYPRLIDPFSSSHPNDAPSFWSTATPLPRLALVVGLGLSAIQIFGAMVPYGKAIAILSFATETLVVVLGFWLVALITHHHVVFLRLRAAEPAHQPLAPVRVPAWLMSLLAAHVAICLVYVVDVLASPADRAPRTAEHLVALGACAFAFAECWVGYVCSIRLREMRRRLSRQ